MKDALSTPSNPCYPCAMPSLIKHLSSLQQKDLFDQLNYLNIKEYTNFCKSHKIPFTICIETEEGKIKKTSDKDRKGIVLKRILQFFKTGKTPAATVIKKEIIRLESAKTLFTKKDRLYYGLYDKKNGPLTKALQSLTEGKFKDGSLARETLRDFWTAGKAPTLEEFAKAWLKALENHKKPNPEWAFLTDRANGVAGEDWKDLRNQKAKTALKTLSQIK